MKMSLFPQMEYLNIQGVQIEELSLRGDVGFGRLNQLTRCESANG